jgi:protocatechuate 3,4-dioxygenase beta subunit
MNGAGVRTIDASKEIFSGDDRVGRRAALGGLAGGLAWAALPPSVRAQAQPAAACVLTPDSGEGPFYFDPKLVRADIGDGRPGAALTASLQVVREGDCRPVDGARVDVWHADALGFYSGYGRQSGTGQPVEPPLGRTFLRGTQFTDAEGRVQFRTIYPSWYRGRTPHLHFKIFVERDQVVASQAFFPDEVNETVFTRFEPYRSVLDRRDTFNSTDRFLRDGTQGAFCSVEQRGDRLVADLVVAIGRA